MATKFALCMGVGDYSVWRAAGWDVADLPFSVKNAEDFAQLLTASFGFDPANVGIQRDAWCNSGSVSNAVHDLLVNQAKPGDVVCVFFSGHGMRVRGLSASGQPHPDLWYEAIVPHSGSLLTDFDMAALARDVDAGLVNLTFVLDTSHFAGLHPVEGAPQPVGIAVSDDLSAAFVQTCHALAPFGVCIGDPDSSLSGNVHSVAIQAGELKIDQPDDARLNDDAKGIVLTACAPDQYAWQAPGLQNSILVGALKTTTGGAAYQVACSDLLSALRASADTLMTQNVRSLVTYSQMSSVPQLYGPHVCTTEVFLAPRAASH